MLRVYAARTLCILAKQFGWPGVTEGTDFDPTRHHKSSKNKKQNICKFCHVYGVDKDEIWISE
jgi:hypothetical protein